MQNPSEHHKLTSENNITKFKKPVHDPFKSNSVTDNWVLIHFTLWWNQRGCEQFYCDNAN